MRIGVVGHFALGSYSAGLASCLNGPLGQTVHLYPINLYPDEYKYIRTYPEKRIPLSRIIDGVVLDYIIVVQGFLYIQYDIDIPVLYFHREPVHKFVIDRFTYIALKYPLMMLYQEIRDFDNKFILSPCTEPSRWDSNKQKDLFIATVSREINLNGYITSMQIYQDLMERAQHVIIDKNYNKHVGMSVRALEGLACRAIPILFVDDIEQDYRDMGFNESNCYFNELPTHYDLEKVKAGYELLKQHTILERAKQILEVIKNETKEKEIKNRGS